MHAHHGLHQRLEALHTLPPQAGQGGGRGGASVHTYVGACRLLSWGRSPLLLPLLVLLRGVWALFSCG